jgi:hypothetical protein
LSAVRCVVVCKDCDDCVSFFHLCSFTTKQVPLLGAVAQRYWHIRLLRAQDPAHQREGYDGTFLKDILGALCLSKIAHSEPAGRPLPARNSLAGMSAVRGQALSDYPPARCRSSLTGSRFSSEGEIDFSESVLARRCRPPTALGAVSVFPVTCCNQSDGHLEQCLLFQAETYSLRKGNIFPLHRRMRRQAERSANLIR